MNFITSEAGKMSIEISVEIERWGDGKAGRRIF
jgi:hypothetical protein